MSSAGFVLAAVGGFAAGVVAMIVGDLLSEEFRERADGLPYWLIQRAGRRLSEDVRAKHVGEWAAELDAILDHHRVKRLPLTRLVIGTRYALGLLRAAGAVDSALHGEGCTRPVLRPRIDLDAVRGVAAVRAGSFGVGLGMTIGTGADISAVAVVALGVGGGVGTFVLGIILGARMAALSALGVGLGAGLSAEFGINARSVSLALGGVLVAALVGTLLAGAGDPGSGEARHRRDRPGDRL
jgi:hypothetical protein